MIALFSLLSQGLISNVWFSIPKHILILSAIALYLPPMLGGMINTFLLARSFNKPSFYPLVKGILISGFIGITGLLTGIIIFSGLSKNLLVELFSKETFDFLLVIVLSSATGGALGYMWIFSFGRKSFHKIAAYISGGILSEILFFITFEI